MHRPRAPVCARCGTHAAPRGLPQDIMGSLYRDGPKKLLKKAKKNAPYFAIFLAFSALPVAMCEYIDHQNMLHHRY